MRVFEIDLPAMQQWKKARLQELNITLPGNLTFVPVDFEKQNLTEELRSHGFRKDIPAFFSWLGVTQYLTESAVFQTLREVASMATGSEIIFEYVLPESLLDGSDRQMVAGGKTNPGEPWISMFEPVELAERVKETGYSEVWDFGPEEAYATYFRDRTDELAASVLDVLTACTLRIAHFMKATV